MFFYALRLSAEHQLGAEMQKIKYDKIRKLDKIVFLALGLILMALVIQMAILNWINNKNTAKMSEVLLDRVVNVIEKNEDDEKNMITSLKENYIVRARSWNGDYEEYCVSLEYSFCNSREEAEERIKNEKYDLMIGVSFTSRYCAEHGFVRSKSIMESNLAYARYSGLQV